MTKTEYEKELEKKIDELQEEHLEIWKNKNIEECDKKAKMYQIEQNINILWDRLYGYKKGKQEEREKIIKLGDKKFISDLYTDNTIDTDSYDIIVNIWERIKRELNQGQKEK